MRLKQLFPLLALTLITAFVAACGPNVRAIGRGVEAGTIEFKREFASMREAGEIDEDTAQKYAVALDEIEATAHDLTLIVNWDAMPKAEKRRTVLIYIGHFARSAGRLDEAGVLGIKSERTRRRVEAFKRNFKRGLGALRIIEAALPEAEATAKQ
ncbi:MAG TPA: hypothetical protein VGB76_06790 [Pyrinomonadaceae bacterium]|jgi:hypothetical protein